MRDRRRRRALIGFGTGQAALLVPMLALERRMKRTGGPGMIPFELAGTSERATQILQTWGPDGQSAARTSLLLDYPYLVTYSALQAAFCDAASDALPRNGPRLLAEAGMIIRITQWGAGVFDAIENAALLAVLANRDGRLPALARRCACSKFALLALGWVYIATGWPPTSRIRKAKPNH
jgi:hypothetical protein